MLVPGSVYGKSIGKGVVVVGGRMTRIVDTKEQDVEYSLLLFLFLSPLSSWPLMRFL